MTKAHVGIWARIIIAVIGIFILQYTIVTSFLCLSFIMMSASLRLIRTSNFGSFFHRVIGFFTGITLGIILLVFSAIIADIIIGIIPSSNFENFFEQNFKYGFTFIVFAALLVIFNTILCVINLFIQYYSAEQLMENQFENQTIFMTGGTSGLGRIAALHALANGAHLILLARDLEKGEALRKTFLSDYPLSTGKLTLLKGDLSSLESVVKTCTDVVALNIEIDQLALNAGIMNFERKLSQNGIEETLQVNLLAPLLIIDKLYTLLKPEGASKIVITSSGLHQGNIIFDDIEFLQSYSAFKAYRQSKLGTILISRLLADELQKTPIYTQHPGVVKTELGRDAGWFSKLIFSLMGSSPNKGARTLIYLMETDNAHLKNGAYYAKKKFKKTSKESYDMQIAQQLLDACKSYLRPYLDEGTSVI